ncbi:peptidase of plants and bacteria-domain-containing protein [Sphaerosporella brunnea]|uniref:Peptidase of plants and bacteria-domain-containing protein n=1 Tax=Sphaerosporella brunnea TaxID=1250544 RepID=A0A5J5F324_9PEZI|nr:peptidase of plants and bacteria-domain-containing protein [Sphaerosporella brunnea]
MQSAIPTRSFVPAGALHNKSPPGDSPTSASSPSTGNRRYVDGWYMPRLDLHFEDLSTPGCRKFLAAAGADVDKLLTDAVVGVCKRLYGEPEKQPTHQESISLYIRPMSGVAYTAGKKNKQIHFSTDYIASIPQERVEKEVLGVVRHEMVHVWQWNGLNTCPGGLIEGIADWVRLRDGFIPPHWSRGGEEWDDGYQHTAYFLDWIEDTFGAGSVAWINSYLQESEYSDGMWQELCGGQTVEALWDTYKRCYDLEGAETAAPVIPTEAVKLSADVSITTEEIPVYNAAPAPGVSSGEHDRNTLVVVDQETEGVESIADSHDSSSSFDQFPYRGEAATADIFAERLKNLTFDGTRDGKRFVKEFEALVDRVNPQMPEADKRLLLVTALVGEKVNAWYEETDLDDELPYAVLADLLQRDWKGNSKRAVGLIDRDAKLA